MSSVLNRITKEFRRSANTPDYPIGDWIINPDMSAVKGKPSKYWVISGDAVTLMDRAAMDLIYAQEESDALDEIADQLERAKSFDKAFALILLDEINILRAKHGMNPRTPRQFRNALRRKL